MGTRTSASRQSLDGSSNRSETDRLAGLRAALLTRFSGSSKSRPADASRQAAATLARVAATDLDRLWRRALRAQVGPIDVIDFFSGCGGMSAGFKTINGLLPAFRLAGAVDVDSVANATYAANLGIEPMNADVSRVARSSQLRQQLMRGCRPGHPLVLIGCAPCQGFSSHRNSNGENDPRNSLFLDFARIAAQIAPDVLVAENVPEILTDRYWPLVARAKSILKGAGYFVHVAAHNLAEFGVPQERFRVLLLAMRRPFRAPSGFLRRSAFRTVRDAIGHLPAVIAGERNQNDPMHYTAGHHASTIATIQAVPKNGGSRPANVGPPCLRRVKERQGRSGYDDVYGRLFWDRPAITITAYARNPASGRFVHPDQDRGLSVREAALLQGFASDYMFDGTLDQRFRQIGNAVPPTFAVCLAAHVVGELMAAPTAEFNEGLTAPVGQSFSRIIAALKQGHVAAAG